MLMQKKATMMTAVSALIEPASELIKKTELLKEALKMCEHHATADELDMVVAKALDFIAEMHKTADDVDPRKFDNRDEYSDSCFNKLVQDGAFDKLFS